MSLFLLFVIFSGAVISWIFLRSIMFTLRLRLLDKPNDRSSHNAPIPSGGGLAFVLVACVSSSYFLLERSSSSSLEFSLLFVPLLALPLALVGLIDDRYNLPSILRFCSQLATAICLIIISTLTAPYIFQPYILLLLLISVCAVINFTNFMDGLDGLVCGCMVVAMTAAAIQLSAPWPIWSLIGALLGFLIWNWSPAKVFMGDVGSTFLGAVFSGMVLHSSSWLDALGLLLVATPLLADACICVLRRVSLGQRVFQAHCLHLFQRLHQSGWSHARVSLVYITASTLLAVAYLVGGTPWVIFFALIVLLIGIWLDQCIAVPFPLAE